MFKFTCFTLLLVALCATTHAEGSDKFSVHIRNGSEMHYELDIQRENSNDVVQTISVRNGVDLNKPGGIHLLDLNADGFEDLRVWGGGAQDKRWYKIWLFDVATGKFVWSHTTESGSGG